MQQGKIAEAEKSIRTLFGKERVAEVMHDLTAAAQGSTEPEAGWFDLFSCRYWKGIPEATLLLLFFLANYFTDNISLGLFIQMIHFSLFMTSYFVHKQV